MPEEPTKTTVEPISDDALTFRTKQEKIESCVLQLKRKGVSKSSAFAICTASIGNSKKASEADKLIKKFAEKTTNSFVGVTGKSGKKKHSHSFTILVLNYGEQLVGVTTGTNGDTDHIHTVSLDLDPKIIALEAKTRMADSPSATNKGDNSSGFDLSMSDYHDHSFKANIEKIRDQVPGVSVRGRYFNENGEEVEGDVIDGLKAMSEQESDKKKGNSKSMKDVISDSECLDNKGHYSFNSERQAIVLLNRVSQLEEKPKWYDGTLTDLQIRVLNEVEKRYPELDLTHINSIEEMAINLAARKRKLDPKAKVRQRGDVVFPANSKDVTDNKDHFPINNIRQARNALARAAQYKASPPWYKGSLAALQQKVRRAVKRKYPSIKVTGLTEFYALRFREENDTSFMYLGTQNVEAAKHDAAIYFNECPKAQIELVKFESKEDGESKFVDLGSIVLYDIAKHSFNHNSEEIKLSEKDNAGNTVIEILREGTFNHEIYGKFTVDNTMMNRVIKNFKDDVLDREVSFDINHEPSLPAAAWVKELSTTRRPIKGENRMVLNAHVRFTPNAEKAIKDGEFKYTSAEYVDNFEDKETGKEYGTTLKGGGLTNRPWIPGLAPIQLSENSSKLGFISKS